MTIPRMEEMIAEVKEFGDNLKRAEAAGSAKVVGRLLARFHALLPDARDVHVYGGGLLISIGAGLWLTPLAFVAFGALLLYLGLRRVKK